MKKHTRAGIAGLFLIILLGLTVRVPAIFQRPLWFDEADTWRSAAAAADVQYIQFFRWTNHFENAPLGYLLPRLVTDVLHTDAAWAMRLPALLLGLLCIPAAYALGYVARSSALGLAVALLVALDPNMVDQSQQCRMYSALALGLLVSATWSIILLRDPDQGMWHWLGLGVVLGWCLWATLLGVIAWIGVALSAALLLAGGYLTGRPHPKTRRIISGFTLAFLVAVFIAQLGVFKAFYDLGHPRRPNQMPALAIAREVVVGMKDLIYPHSSVGLLVFPLALLGLVLLWRSCKTSAAVVGGLALANLLLMFPFRRQHHLMDSRYLTMLEPALWIGLGALATQPTPSSNSPTAGHAPKFAAASTVGLVLVLLYAGFQSWQCQTLEHWWEQPDKYLLAPEMVRVRDLRQADEAVVLDPPVTDILARYYRLPVDPTLDRAFHANYHPRPDPQVPADFSAPATWLIIGMINDAKRLDPADERYVRRPIEALARHYGLAVDAAAYRKNIGQNRVITIRFSKDGMEWRSVGG